MWRWTIREFRTTSTIRCCMRNSLRARRRDHEALFIPGDPGAVVRGVLCAENQRRWLPWASPRSAGKGARAARLKSARFDSGFCRRLDSLSATSRSEKTRVSAPSRWRTSRHFSPCPGLRAFFGGPFEFASVELQDASLNLTRVDLPVKSGPNDFRWNFASLLQSNMLAAFPSIHMRGGRINFKFGDTKSLFYLLNTDVDLWPPGSAKDPWTLRVHGEPARTDRPARGFGSFAARGQWLQRDGSTTLDVKLEQSELGDMLTLFNGYESGINGHISG